MYPPPQEYLPLQQYPPQEYLYQQPNYNIAASISHSIPAMNDTAAQLANLSLALSRNQAVVKADGSGLQELPQHQPPQDVPPQQRPPQLDSSMQEHPLPLQHLPLQQNLLQQHSAPQPTLSPLQQHPTPRLCPSPQQQPPLQQYSASEQHSPPQQHPQPQPLLPQGLTLKPADAATLEPNPNPHLNGSISEAINLDSEYCRSVVRYQDSAKRDGDILAPQSRNGPRAPATIRDNAASFSRAKVCAVSAACPETGRAIYMEPLNGCESDDYG
jgi:hypothetical protein